MKKLEKMKYLQRGYWTFLLENEMQVYLVVFGKEAFALSEKLFKIYKTCYNIKLSQRENQR